MRLREQAKEGLNIGCWALVIVAFVVIVPPTIYYAILPTWRNMETAGFQASYEKVQTDKTQLLQLKAQYEQLDGEIAYLRKGETNGDVIEAKQRQQTAILAEMRQRRGMMPAEQVPSEVAVFLGMR